MEVSPSSWFFLSYLVSVVGIFYGSSPCEKSTVVFRSSYATFRNRTTGLIGLLDTFPLITIENGSVRCPYSQLSLGDVAVEVNFTRRQEGVLSELRRTASTFSVVSVTRFCPLVEAFSCDLICRIDDDYLEILDGEIGRRTLRGEDVERACKTDFGTALLKDAWTRIRPRWRDVCAYFEKAGTIEVKISFRYRTNDTGAWCDVSVSQPVRCKLTIYNGTRVVYGYPCSRDGLTVGGSIFYEIEKPEDTKGLKCSVSGELVREVFAELEVSEPVADFPDATSIEDEAVKGSRDTSVGLSVGFVCVFLIAAGISILASRRGLGLRTLDRVGFRVACRRAETAG